MAILKIAKLGHPVLVKKTNEINNLNELNLKKIVFDMSETMLDAEGLGLAAPQVHLSNRMFICRNPEIEEGAKINISVFINPVIEKLSDETEDDWEGCLSIPGMSGLVRRFKRIKYSAKDLNGNNIVGEVEGLHARVIQHEFDHLDGILFPYRVADPRHMVSATEFDRRGDWPEDWPLPGAKHAPVRIVND